MKKYLTHEDARAMERADAPFDLAISVTDGQMYALARLLRAIHDATCPAIVTIREARERHPGLELADEAKELCATHDLAEDLGYRITLLLHARLHALVGVPCRYPDEPENAMLCFDEHKHERVDPFARTKGWARMDPTARRERGVDGA